MTSTHPDYAGVDLRRAGDAEMLKYVQDNDVPATRSMNGAFLELDSKRGFARCRFKIGRLPRSAQRPHHLHGEDRAA